MSPAGRWLILAVAIASLGVTAMITLKVGQRYLTGLDQQVPAFRGGPDTPDNTSQPPILATLPDFTLTERSGLPLASTSLRGKVWIADFIFTTCGGPCPLMSAQMQGLQDKLAKKPYWNGVRLVSLSVDPERDTPAALREYAAQFAADPDHWLFLTGPRETLWTLTRDGFKLPVGQSDENAQMPIFHSAKFVLVDRAGRLRGYYNGLEAQGRADLLRDLERILGEGE